MWKRRLLISLLALATLGGCAVFLAQRYGDNLSIELTEQELQTRLAARFPIQNCSLVVLCVDVTAPEIKLTDGSERIALAAKMSASLGTRRYPGAIAFSGKLRYVAQDGEFFLDDIEIERLELEGVPAKYADILRSNGPAALRGVLAQKPIYTLSGDGAKMRLARLAVGDIRVLNGKLRIAFTAPK